MLEPVDPADIRNMIQIGPPTLTRFERARILGTRALQISMGAPVLIEFDSEEESLSDPLLIADRELQARVLPISVRRSLTGGKYQDIPINWLIMKNKERISM